MLVLKTLRLSGWMSYSNAEFILDAPGITSIKGDVGSGKSSIVEAVCYLLFGVLIRDKSSVKDLVNRVLGQGYDISIDIELDGVPATIREIREREDPKVGSGLFFTLPESSTPDQRGKSDPETRKKIIKFLKMTVEEFKSSCILGQRQTQSLVEGTAGKRAKAIVELYGLDRYDIGLKACKDDITSKANKKTLLEKSLSLCQESLSEITKPTPIVDEDSFDFTEVNSNIKKTEDRLQALQEESNRLSKLLGQHEAMEKNRRKKKVFITKLEELQEKLDSYALDKNLDKQTLQDRVTQYTEKKSLLAAEISSAEADLRKVKNLDNTCPIVHKECPVNLPIEHATEIKDRCNSEISKCRDTLENKVSPIIREAQDSLSELKDKEKVVQQIQETENLVSSLDENCDSIDVSVVDARLEKCRGTIDKGKNHLSTLRDDKQKEQERKVRLEEAKKYNERMEKLRDQKEKEAQSLEVEIADLAEELKYLNGAISVLKRAKLAKISSVLDLINDTMEGLLRRITKGKLTAKFVSAKLDYKGKNILDKVDIIVSDQYKTLPINMWSGGQITQVGLGVLLSVFKTASDLAAKRVNCLWLDEPFGPLNQDLVNTVFEAIVDVLNSLDATSLKIISHKDLDSRLWDHLWEAELVDGITRVTVS